MGAMNGLKKFGLVVSVGLFGPLFLLSVSAYAFNKTVGNENYVKKTIKEAKFYDAASQALVDSAVGADDPDPIIKSALQTAASPKTIEKVLDPAITSTYDWLGGEVTKPDYTLSLTQIRVSFEKSLTSKLKARAKKLPACTYYGQSASNDIFSATCIPAGTDVNQVISDAVSRITTNADIFSDKAVADGSVDAKDAKDAGISLPTDSPAPIIAQSYQFFKKGFPFFVIGTIITAIGTLLLSSTLLRGARKLGILLLMNGFFLLISGLVLQFLLGSLLPTTAVTSTEASVNALQEAAKMIIADNASTLKTVGISSVIAGLAATIASTILIRKKQSPK